MDPHLYCQEALTELLDDTGASTRDRERLQRAAVLAYLARRRPSAEDFARELRMLARDATHGRPAIAAAARAILLDWRGRAETAGFRAGR